jgi:hypothetical protein
MCGAVDSDALPAVWSLAQAGGAPLSPGDSLAGAGVLDGATLYLRDTREGEALDLVVTDLDEQIAQALEDDTVWSARTRALTTLCAGLLVVLISAGWLGVRHPTVTSVSMALAVFPVVALCSALVAWYSTRKVWPIPSAVRQAFALLACPLMASAGLGEPVRGAVITPVLVCVAAAVGAFVGMIALPAISTVVLTILTTITAVFAIPLVAGHAGMTASAALVSTVVFLAASVLPWVNSRIAILVPGEHDVSGPAVDGEDVAKVVGRGNRLLIFLRPLRVRPARVCECGPTPPGRLTAVAGRGGPAVGRGYRRPDRAGRAASRGRVRHADPGAGNRTSRRSAADRPGADAGVLHHAAAIEHRR